MEFPSFRHADFLDRAWKDGTPAYNIGSSSMVRHSWVADGLPALPTDIDSHLVNLKPQPALNAAIAHHLDTTPDRVAATAGTSGGNLAAMLWAFRPGCNMIVERPIYSQLSATAAGLGAEVRPVARDASGEGPEAWRLHPDDVAAAMDDDTALVILASPNNPTQAAASVDDLRAFGELAEKHDCYILLDQVYRELTDDPLGANVHDRIISTAGVNKSWGLPGIRIGWMTGAPDVIDALQLVHTQTMMAPNAPFEAVAIELLAMADRCRADLHERLAATHPIYRDWIEETPGVSDPNPRHLTAFPKLPVADTAEFCERISLDPGVVTVPGEYFDWPGHCRIGLGGDPDHLAEGLAVLAREIKAAT